MHLVLPTLSKVETQRRKRNSRTFKTTLKGRIETAERKGWGVEGNDERNKKAGKWLYKRKCTYKSINGVKSRGESAGQNESKTVENTNKTGKTIVKEKLGG